jgi:hypothetical protein
MPLYRQKIGLVSPLEEAQYQRTSYNTVKMHGTSLSIPPGHTTKQNSTSTPKPLREPPWWERSQCSTRGEELTGDRWTSLGFPSALRPRKLETAACYIQSDFDAR